MREHAKSEISSDKQALLEGHKINFAVAQWFVHGAGNVKLKV